jgi:4-hydroxybenzoyl-CoA reductase subunit beta
MLRLHEYTYHRPVTLIEAAELLAASPGRAMLISGGTDLMPNMKHGLFEPTQLIALRQIAALHGIEEQNGELVIGAAESLASVARNETVKRLFPALADAAGHVAGPQLRNMGTIGGNLCLDTRCTYYNQTFFWRNALGFCLKKDGEVCHVTKTGRKCVAAHSADTPPVLMTLGATADLVSKNGTRTIPVADFFVADGMANTVRGWDEIVSRIRIPLSSVEYRTSYQKLRQRGGIDYPLLNMGAAAAFDGDVIRDVKLVVSGLGSRPRVVTGLDKVANGRPMNAETIDAIAQRAYAQCHPLENIIVDPEWRHAMVSVYVKRAFESIR